MSDAASSVAHDAVNPTKWIALLGRQDEPTDGVEDYCSFLGRALASQGIELEQVRVPWGELGWIGALRQLSRREFCLAGEMGPLAVHNFYVVAARLSVGGSRRDGDSSPLRRASGDRVSRSLPSRGPALDRSSARCLPGSGHPETLPGRS